MNKEQFLENLELKGFLVSKSDDFEKTTDYDVIVAGKTVKVTFYDNFEDRPMIPQEMKNFWLENLRSGKFKQGRGCLHRDGKFCCLGVWAYINNPELDNYGYIKGYSLNNILKSEDKLAKIIKEQGEFIGFRINGWGALTSLNDNSDSFEVTSWVIEYFF